jgi:REP element-mobilizing transposase RayT
MFPGRNPGLVTIRVRPGVPSLRNPRLIAAFERAFWKSTARGDVRVVHYSVQHDHVHLLVEAADRAGLARGMKSLTARLAHAVNRVSGRRGSVVDGRFHHRALGTPREVRAALAYVLLNSRKHALAQGLDLGEERLARDPATSGRFFDGWAGAGGCTESLPVVEPRTWLLRAGWRRHGLIHRHEIPGAPRA